jgi:hypothetical protein
MRRLVLSTAACLLASCAARVDAPRAPAPGALDVPQLTRLYEADGENRARQTLEVYLEYVRMFFEGRGLAPGWNSIAARLSAKAGEEERPEISERLSRLGAAVSVEWARDNGIRRVDTTALRAWAAQLARAGESGRIGEALAAVEREAAARIGGSLPISKGRTAAGGTRSDR